jgi:hypothetical protein
MRASIPSLTILIVLECVLVAAGTSSCSSSGASAPVPADDELQIPVDRGPSPDVPPVVPAPEDELPPPEPVPADVSKWELWTGGTRLRGANIHQRRSHPEADGDIVRVGPVIPRYTDSDFQRLRDHGANWVDISHPGLFSESAPFVVDRVIEENLDGLLDQISRAGLRAVISFRTGPGRNEFTFLSEESPFWVGRSLDVNTVWTDRAAQDGWVAMWRYTADRYRGHPAVIGYDLMVEPNSNVPLGVFDPKDFYARFAGTTQDWNQLHPRITAAIREVDTETPILVGGLHFSSIHWLAFIVPSGDARTVYTVHSYAPFEYTHQSAPFALRYPGRFDADGDGDLDDVNKAWIAESYAAIDEFRKKHGVPVAVNEFGVQRFQPGASEYLGDSMSVLESLGVNHAWWAWMPDDARFADFIHDFDPFFGADPGNRVRVADSDLLFEIKSNWSRNP